MLLFILIVVVVAVLAFVFEPFEVVEYNSTDIPNTTVISSFENDTIKLNNLFNSYNDVFDTKDYIIQNPNIPFMFNDSLKQIILDYFKNNIYKNDKLSISDLKYIYWKDLGSERHFIFNVNITNNTSFITRNIKIKLTVTNISQGQVDIRNTKIVSIKLDDNDNVVHFDDFLFKGIDSLQPSDMYLIKNELHLMDPLLTSGKEMIITQDMKHNFEKELQQHEIDKSKLVV